MKTLKPYLCSCGETDPAKFYKDRKSQCKQCSSKKVASVKLQKRLNLEEMGSLGLEPLTCKQCGMTKAVHLFRVENQSRCIECLSQLNKSYRTASEEKYLKSLLRHRKNQAKKARVPFNITLGDLPPIPKVCPVFGHHLVIGTTRKNQGQAPSLDRIRPELGYVPGNVQIISHRANTLKNNARVWELLKVALGTFKHYKDQFPGSRPTVEFLDEFSTFLQDHDI